jgi:hypothetical protein
MGNLSQIFKKVPAGTSNDLQLQWFLAAGRFAQPSRLTLLNLSDGPAWPILSRRLIVQFNNVARLTLFNRGHAYSPLRDVPPAELFRQ